MEEEEIFFEGNLASVLDELKEKSEHIQSSGMINSYIPVLNFADLKDDKPSIISGIADCGWKDACKVTTPSIDCSENDTSNSTVNLADPAFGENQTMRTNFHANSPAASSNFHIDSQAIPCVPQDEQDEELLHLGVSVYDQTQFENEVMGQVDKALKDEEEKRRKLEVERDLKAVSDDIRLVKERLSHIDKVVSLTLKNEDRPSRDVIRELNSMKKERENKSKHLKKLEAKCRALCACVTGDLIELQESLKDDSPESAGLDLDIRYHMEKAFSSKETDEEHMIRTGQMTPFGTTISGREQKAVSSRKIRLPEDEFSGFGKFLLDQAESHQCKKSVKLHLQKNRISNTQSQPSTSKCLSEQFLHPPSVLKTHPVGPVPAAIPPLIPKLFKYKKKTEKVKLGSRLATGMKVKKNAARTLVENYRSDSDISDIETGDFDMKDDDDFSGSDKEYVPDVDLSEDSDMDHYVPKGKKAKRSSENSEAMQWSDFKSPKKKYTGECDDGISHSVQKKVVLNRKRNVIDDGCQKSYVRRMKLLQKAELIKKHKKIMESNSSVDPDSDDESYIEFDGDFKMPSTVWNKLYRYQQTCVRWLWELHQQNCGGIMGDEMGLGKTIQVIAFLVGLKCSNVLTDGDNFQGLGPVILVCPATVLHQWVKEFHTWWPKFRVAILHESGSYSGPKEVLIRMINKSRGVLLTSYAGIVLHQEPLLDHDWHYVILDEGHKIRNPDAQATLVVKQFRTQHRVILSGSPVQNNLKELWSLFDFIFPGKLGTLPVFMQQFSVPIVQGGYSNASQVQRRSPGWKCQQSAEQNASGVMVKRMLSIWSSLPEDLFDKRMPLTISFKLVQTAYKCATVLRDTIKPYLLRRMKADVKMSINLPNKSEQVLFCQCTEEQKQLYKDYLASPQIVSIINGSLQIFVGLINLRKICNHPDLYDGGPKIFKDTDISSLSEDMHYGYYKRSGKMMVVEALLHLWHKQSHRVLLFTQSRQMMEILEHFVKTRGYTYMRMDGSTSIKSRQPLISKFNSDPSIFVFLLTTRVGGLGVNLTGANRVVIYDPDWNPSTDAQARERAWRIGQEKQVTIYRLLTAGTIEEKIYHRQIFKQFVTNRVLKDPRQRRFFKSNDLYELFTFTEMGKEGTETSAIFAGTGSEIKPVKNRKVKCEPPRMPKAKTTFTAEKLEKMKQLAKKLSLKLSSVVSTPEEPSEKGDMRGVNVSEYSAVSTSVKELSSSASSEPSENLKKTMSFKNTKDSSSDGKKAESSGKRNRISKSRVVDGEKIDYVVKKDVYKPASEEEETSSQQDDYVLSKLFKKSGVHTALKHDMIVESSNPDYLLVEGEANRVAKEAVKALKASRRFCARAQEGIPTWTGLHGGATQGPKPRFGLKKKNMKDLCTTASPTSNEESNPGTSSALQSKPGIFGKRKTDGGSAALSSTDLLSAIKNRKKAFASSHDGNSSDEEGGMLRPNAQKPATDFDELLVELRNYIAFQASVDGQATTAEILEAFKDKLPCHQAPVFKSLLSRICEFSRNSSGDGVWSLKGEFR